MAMLFLARYRAEKYRDLGKDKGQTPILRPDGEFRTDDQQSAREGAKKLFGWEYVKPYPATPPGYNPGTGEAEPLQGEPSGEVDLHCAHAFLYSKANPNQLGWVAIVSDATYGQMKHILEWPHGPLCQMYEIEIIPLNDDDRQPRTQLTYIYMTPSSWGPTMSA